MAEREAAGESFWTSRFTTEVRVKIKLAAADAFGYAGDSVYQYAHGLLIRQYGQDGFTTTAHDPTGDLIGALTIGD